MGGKEFSIHFGWADYFIFAMTLALSLVIGVYHAWRGAASSTTKYLFGGSSMGILPIAMSFTASSLSTIAMLGTPTDVYLTGAMLFWMPVGFGIGALISAYVYLPLFQDLGILSISQYLELRFHRHVRRLFSAITLFGNLFFLAIVTYAPSLAFSQVTGLNVYISATIAFAVCTFYTTIGGLKAVVWSDAIQIILMISAMAILVIKGVIDVGIDNVWERNLSSGRLEFFNVDPDPTTQKTVWTMLIAYPFFWTGLFSRSQGSYQRFLAVPTRRHAQKALIINIFFGSFFLILCFSSGLVAYSKYYDCDPIKAKFVEKADQIVLYFVMDTLGSLPGLPGLFLAGIFSASLSSLSTILNGMALTVLEDFVRPFSPNLKDSTATRISKWISFGFGLLSYFLVFPMSNVKSIFEAGASFDGAAVGMSLGIFTLGMLIPWANTIGAIVGMIISYVSMISLGILAQAAKTQGLLPNKQLKPTSIENCLNLNITIANASHRLLEADEQPIQEETFYLLRLSLFWYPLIGTLIVIIVGALVSLLPGLEDANQRDPKLFFYCLRRRLTERKNERLKPEQEIVQQESLQMKERK